MGIYVTRRRAVQLAASLAAAPILSALEERDPTHEVSEGPAYKAGAPMRRELIDPGTAGGKFLLRGQVYSATSEKPIPQATLDLWSVQNNGEYDSKGFNLRGRQQAAAKGDFEFLTIEAVSYGGRTAHFHFKVSASGFKPLTTELYLPGIERNRQDGAFRESNLLQVVAESGIRKGRYEFYLRPL
jgi:protocatechuate 3,4-dioxygenase beta subunit